MLCILLLTACGQNHNTPKGSEDEPVNSDKNTSPINAISLTPSLIQQEGEGKEFKFLYTVENNTDKPVQLTFNTGQTFDYIVKDQADKTIIHYSDGKSFTQAIVEKEIAANAQLTHEIILENLEPGEYTLEAWLTAKGMKEDSKEIIKFKVE